VKTRSAPPISVGSGFVALDLLMVGGKKTRADHQYAGGSCGNVLTILAYLDWHSLPVARLGTDRRATRLIDDLRSFRVDTRFVTKERYGVTPVIVVRMAKNAAGAYTTRFEWRDPASGAWLPRYRPLPKKIAERVSPQLPAAKVFYFDRAEPSALLLATSLREKGAVIFFEPSSCKNDDLFTACLGISDIVKYSSQRIPTAPRNPVSHSPRLEIQTLGAEGLRYRLKMTSHRTGVWHRQSAYPAAKLVDPTGCGDWCSAGIIAKLCASGRANFLAMSEANIAEGIRFGQALAAVNCEHQGARGPMYAITSEELLQSVDSLNHHPESLIP
jgi:fructokinase